MLFWQKVELLENQKNKKKKKKLPKKWKDADHHEAMPNKRARIRMFIRLTSERPSLVATE